MTLTACLQPHSPKVENTAPKNEIFLVVFSSGEGTGAPPPARKVDPDTVILLPNSENLIAPQGKKFNGWKTGETVYGATTPYTITADVTFTAHWKETPVFQNDTFVVYYYEPAAPAMNVYYWTLDGIYPEWPGTPMTKGNDGWWTGTVANPLGVIFNNNSGQTVDLSRTKTGYFLPSGTTIEGKITGVWLDENPKSDDFTFLVYYYDNSASVINVYYWTLDGIHPKWPGTPMTKGDDGWWTGTVRNPLGVIFNDGNRQTVDLTRTTTGYFFPGGTNTEEKITGTWSDIKPDAPEPPPKERDDAFTVYYYDNTVRSMNVYYFIDSGGENPSWPGNTMTNLGDGWFSATVPSSTGIVFNDANQQTVDLARTNTGYFLPEGTNAEGKITGAWHDTKPLTEPGEQSYYYPGTGKTYAGFRGTQGKHSTTFDEITITYPNELYFSADAFFTLEGRVKNAHSHNYAWVEVKKNGYSDLTTSYFVRGVFKTKIWLRFGPGDYTVTVIRMTEVWADSPDGNPNGGDILRWRHDPSKNITFRVTNTRNDDGDARWLYPSAVVQSDSQIALQLADSITRGIISEKDKIRAVHDYLIKNTIYDRDSLNDGKRRKQDAVTVLGDRYDIDRRYSDGHFLAVCEGYANAAAALLRAVGIKTKFIASNKMNHGWNNVYVDGLWKFMDVTWDDPVPDQGPFFTRDKYFLLNSLNGINNDHYGFYDDARTVFPVIQGQKGMPDGWY
jgi:hypothetical protein